MGQKTLPLVIVVSLVMTTRAHLGAIVRIAPRRDIRRVASGAGARITYWTGHIVLLMVKRRIREVAAYAIFHLSPPLVVSLRPPVAQPSLIRPQKFIRYRPSRGATGEFSFPTNGPRGGRRPSDTFPVSPRCHVVLSVLLVPDVLIPRIKVITDCPAPVAVQVWKYCLWCFACATCLRTLHYCKAVRSPLCTSIRARSIFRCARWIGQG